MRLPNCEEFECIYAFRLMAKDIQNEKKEVVCCSLESGLCNYQNGKQRASCIALKNKSLHKVTDRGDDGCGLCECVFRCERADTV